MPDLHPIQFLRRAVRLARTEFAALSALMIIAFGILAFVELADDMTESDGQAFDDMVLAAVRPNADAADPWGPWWLHEAAADLTSLGGISVLGLFATLAVLFLVAQRKRLSAVLLVLGLTGGVALSEGLKSVFERARPPAEYQVVETLNASFPSGHALLSTVFYLTVGVLLARVVKGRRVKALVIGAAISIALLVGITRVYLGAHWASDVLGGWSVGAAWAMALWLVAHAVERRQKAHHAALRDEPAPAETPPISDDTTETA